MFDGTVTGIEPEKDEETGKESDVLLYTITYEDGDRYGRRDSEGEHRPSPGYHL